MSRFDWVKNNDPKKRLFIYRGFLSSDEIGDRKLFSILTKMLASDTEVLELSNHALDNVVFKVLQKCVEHEELGNCDKLTSYLETSEDERYKQYATWVKEKILHKEKPEEISEILSENNEENQSTTQDGEKDEDDISVEEFEKKIISIDITRMRELFESGKVSQTKAYIHRMRNNPSKYRTYSLEYLRMKKELAFSNAAKFRTSDPRLSETLEHQANEYERLAVEATRLLATQEEPLEEELLPIIMKHAILEPEDKNLASRFALRYLKEPTCFRSIEKEAICVMLVRLYKNQGEYDKIVGLLDTLMSGLNDSNRTNSLNPYEKELLRNLGEAYLIQSNGKLGEEDLQKLTTFVNNFSDPNNPKHDKFLNELIDDLKSREALFSVDMVNFSIIPPTTVDPDNGQTPIPPEPPSPDVYGKYSSELSLEKRIEYIAQKECLLGFDARGIMSLDDDKFTGYMLIKWISPDGEREEPFYHVEKLFDIKKIPVAQRSECLRKLREYKENNPNIDLYTLRDVAVNQIGIPEAYGAASYLIKAGDDEFAITSELGELVRASKLIEEFENAAQEALEMPEDEREEFLKQFKVLKYNHTTGKNLSNPVWYEKTNKAYDAFRALAAAESGVVYQKNEAESQFEYDSRNARVKAYTSTPNLDPKLVKIYLLMNFVENAKYNYMKMEQELVAIEQDLNMVPDIEVEGVAEADVLLQRLANVYKRKYGKDIYEEIETQPEDAQKDEDDFLKEPKSSEEQKNKSDILGKYDYRYKEHKKAYSKEISDDDVIPQASTEEETKEKMIELLKEYREFSYRASMEYRRKIVAYANMKIAMKNNKDYRGKLLKSIDDLKTGKATVDPLTGEIIRTGTTGAPASAPPTLDALRPTQEKTGTDR